MTMNETSFRRAMIFAADAARHRTRLHTVGGALVIDCGIDTPGGLTAGQQLAELSAGSLLDVQLVPDPAGTGLAVAVATDHPVRACLGAQYAGHRLDSGMASGPFRALLAREAVYADYPLAERAGRSVVTLESAGLPGEPVVAKLAADLQLAPEKIIILAAPCASIAGTVQVVARSLETALHRLHHLKFDLNTILSGHGVAPMPAVAADELSAVGNTNDSILYGSKVTLYVNTADEVIQEIGSRLPSSASKDYGLPFLEIYKRAGDFYNIDPGLFAPALVTFYNLSTGTTATFGKTGRVG